MTEETVERRHGPRASTVVVGTLMAGAVAVGAVVAVNKWVSPSKQADVAETTTTVDKIDVQLLGSGSANKVIDRTTESGIQIRVHLTDDPGFMGFPQGDINAPDWCSMTSMAMVSAVSPDAVAQTQMPITKAPAERVRFAVLGRSARGFATVRRAHSGSR